MKVLFVLLVAFAASLGINKLLHSDWHLITSGNIAMCIMLCFTAFAHFAFTKGMVMMMPPFLPSKKLIVYITGFLEIAAGICLLFMSLRFITSVWLIIFFVLLLPANIYSALSHVNMQKADYSGDGPNYLWFRIPMQLLLIGWVWYFGIYH